MKRRKHPIKLLSIVGVEAVREDEISFPYESTKQPFKGAVAWQN